jgi:hypothetical protein
LDALSKLRQSPEDGALHYRGARRHPRVLLKLGEQLDRGVLDDCGQTTEPAHDPDRHAALRRLAARFDEFAGHAF